MNPINPGQVKNIIFDLGGVILNLDYYKTERAFINLGITNIKDLYSQFNANNLFKDFEKGRVTPSDFVRELRSYAPGISEADIINAWNAMLLDFPRGRMEFLLNLKKRYNTFLLSNTNAIHHQAFQKIDLNGLGKLDDFFHKAYYSHEIGKRKPDLEAFEYVLTENDLKPEETIFIDDTLSNIEAAKSAKLQAIFLAPSENIEDVLSDLNS